MRVLLLLLLLFKPGGNARPGGGPHAAILFMEDCKVGAKLADMIAGSWNGGCALLKPRGSAYQHKANNVIFCRTHLEGWIAG